MYQKMIEQVKEFYIAFKQEEHLKDYGITPERMVLRNKLWNEECEELVEAIEKKDKVKILDAIVDMMYVRIGTLLEHHRGAYFMAGNDMELINCSKYFTKHIDINLKLLEDAFDEVHRSNMSKLDENGEPIFREDGKVMKGSNYFKPNLKTILEKYGEL